MQTNRIDIIPIDLNFLGLANTIACYLVPTRSGGILIESGPGSTIQALDKGLKQHGLAVKDIHDVFLTHIHLDHAGAAGWLAQQGARIHVHPVGAPHLLAPERLISSAQRIYGEMMDQLWGEFLPTPEDRLSILADGQVMEVEGIQIEAIDTPGHAYHHFAYIIDDMCFSGDIGGVRMPGLRHLRAPMPPPEFHLESWRESIRKLQQRCKAGDFTRIAPTHFGIFNDPGWHLAELTKTLDAIDEWMQRVMLTDPNVSEINEKFIAWTRQNSVDLSEQDVKALEAANPSWMSAAGMQRYWRKFRTPDDLE